MPLSHKRQAFVDEYCMNGFNASQAYKKAYPGCKGGWNKLSTRLMANEGVRAAITAKLKEKAAKVDVTIDFVLKKILSGLELAEKRGDLPAIARFTDQLGRYLAMFTDRVQQSGDGLTINVSNKAQPLAPAKGKPRLATG